MVGETTTTTMISKSIYILCTGSNDITNTYSFRRLKYNISTYTDFMASQATKFLKVSTYEQFSLHFAKNDLIKSCLKGFLTVRQC